MNQHDESGAERRAADQAPDTDQIIAALLEEPFPALSTWIDGRLELLEARWQHMSTPASLRSRRSKFGGGR